jgi:predicted component of type VI protein secretion system
MLIIDKQNIQSYQLLQLLHLLHQQNDQIQLNAFPSFGFPSSDTANFIDTPNQTILKINVLGLLGIDSPLPEYMNLIDYYENNQIWLDFLNIFNHEFYKLLYALWLKYHPIFLIQNTNAWYITSLNALSAFSFTEKTYNSFYLSQFFCRKIKNRHDLKQIACQILHETNIEIEALTPSWLFLSNPTRLNHTAALGNDTILGNRVLNITTIINFHIKLKNIYKAKQLLKGQTLYQKLTACIQQFLGPSFICKIVINTEIRSPTIPKLNEIHLDGLHKTGTHIIWTRDVKA